MITIQKVLAIVGLLLLILVAVGSLRGNPVTVLGHKSVSILTLANTAFLLAIAFKLRTKK